MLIVLVMTFPAAIYESVLWIHRKMRERRADEFFRKKYNGGWEETSW